MPTLTELINSYNPEANPDLPYVQGGNTGGWIDGIGETIGPGRSITSGQRQQQLSGARAAGIPDSYINDFLSRNPGDTNRLIEAYNSEYGGAGEGYSRAQSGAMQSAGHSFTNTPSGSGGSNSGGGNAGQQRWGETRSLGDFASPDSIRAFTEQFNAPSLEDARNSVGWQFRVGEAQKGLERGAAAKGSLLTGGFQSAMAGRLQDLASSEYDKIYGRAQGEYGNRFNIHQANETNRYNSQRSNVLDQFGIYSGERGMNRNDRLDDFNIWNTMDQNYYNRMAGLSNAGLSAAGSMGGLLTGIGNVQGAGTIGSSNAWTNALGGIGQQLQGQQSRDQSQQTLESMLRAGYGQWQTAPGGQSYPGPANTPVSSPQFINPDMMFTGGGGPDGYGAY